MIKYLAIPLILVGCTAPVTDPPAHACSPRLDGGETYCPPFDDDVACLSLNCPKPKPRPNPPDAPRGEIDIWSNAGLWQLHYMYQRAERRRQIEANMTPPTYSINKALLEFNYGSDGSTKSEELLQFPSNQD